MGEKKGKALALELIDDLLNDKSDDLELDKDEPHKNQKRDATAIQPAVGQAFEHASTELENDKTVDLSNEAADENATVPLTTEERHANTLAPKGPRVSHSHEERRPRTSVGRHAALRSGAPNATEAALAQSESLRIAQNRILELEHELERLRIQNEELGAAGETLRRRTDELLAQNGKRESDYQNAVSTFDQEKEILQGSKEAMARELELARRKNEEMELRISSNIQKIRVRERELENRLELVKMESAALIRSKDEMILESKRQIDQLNMELSNYRNKNQELNRVTSDKQEMLRRTVKALRLALSMLEGEE
jgi:hypothetical protein